MAPIFISPNDHFAPTHCHLKDATGVTQQTVDTLYTMMEQEVTYSCSDYLYRDDCSADEYTAAISHKLTSDDRAKIVDWCYSAIDLCQIDRVNVAMAMNIVDRFMSNPCQLSSIEIPPQFSRQEILYDRNMYQLLAVSALYIAIKINGEVILSAGKLAALSRGTYSMENIEAMERTILYCLSWRVCAPTAIQVGHAILELMMYQVHEDSFTVVKSSRWESIREELAFQTENAVRDYQLAIQSPSTIAFMAIWNAIKNVQKVKDGESNILSKALLDILVEVKRLTAEG